MASESEQEKRETMADIVAAMHNDAELYHAAWLNDPNENPEADGVSKLLAHYAGRIESAIKIEHDLIRSCARWILTHDVYCHMAKELLEDCKKILGDDGQFLNK